jgi:NADH:ubiquinone oxidoreductase subunit 5 (subunit L)/multisubunit Na+/H+ antiporter MnhA subunit
MGDSQDIRFIGDLVAYIPFTSSSLMVSNFALCGIPFLAGVYSKDFILEMFSMRYVNIIGFILCLCLQVWRFVVPFVCIILFYVVILILFLVSKAILLKIYVI